MNLQIDKEGERAKICLFGPLSVAEVLELHQRIAQVLPCNAVLEIDASRVERIDTSVAQLFAYLAGRVQRLAVIAASPAWEEAVRTLGLPHLLCREFLPREDHGDENDSVSG